MDDEWLRQAAYHLQELLTMTNGQTPIDDQQEVTKAAREFLRRIEQRLKRHNPHQGKEGS